MFTVYRYHMHSYAIKICATIFAEVWLYLIAAIYINRGCWWSWWFDNFKQAQCEVFDSSARPGDVLMAAYGGIPSRWWLRVSRYNGTTVPRSHPGSWCVISRANPRSNYLLFILHMRFVLFVLSLANLQLPDAQKTKPVFCHTYWSLLNKACHVGAYCSFSAACSAWSVDPERSHCQGRWSPKGPTTTRCEEKRSSPCRCCIDTWQDVCFVKC